MTITQQGNEYVAWDETGITVICSSPSRVVCQIAVKLYEHEIINGRDDPIIFKVGKATVSVLKASPDQLDEIINNIHKEILSSSRPRWIPLSISIFCVVMVAIVGWYLS